MGLLSNGWLYNSEPVSFYGTGNFDCGQLDYFNQQRSSMSYWLPYSDTVGTTARKSAIPVGYTVGGRFLALESGGMGMTNSTIWGSADLDALMAAGKNLEAALSGTGTLVASQLQTVISMAANLSASGTISNAQLVSFVNMVAAITASGTMTATIGALSNLIASITATGSMSPEMNATANMEADITPFTSLSPESLASAVWNAEAASYNASGSMGEKVNAAGTAGDPWTTDLSTYNTDGTAGKVVKQIKSMTGAQL